MTIAGNHLDLLTSLSDALAGAVDHTAQSIVRLEARERRSQGTGVIWTEDGVIVTADHVLERGNDVTVILPDGRPMRPTVIGRDADRDVALLRVDANDLIPISRGVQPKVGHLVLAVGRIGTKLMATMGMVNAVRPAGTRNPGTALLQTDVLLYPGFSGGPLVDAAGQMVGMNTSQNRSGASLAVSLDGVQDTAEQALGGGSLR